MLSVPYKSKPGPKPGAPISAKYKRKRKDGQPMNPGQPKKLQSRLNELRALELRLEGKSYDDIGEIMQMSGPACYTMIMRVLKKNNEDCKERIPEARRIELERCDKLLNFIWPRCSAGDTKAVDAALRIAKRRAELEGLDAPVNVKATGEGGTILVEVFRKMIEDATGKDEEA
jgi:hypothetical protein